MSTLTIEPNLGLDPTNIVRENVYHIASLMSPDSFAAIKTKLGLSEPYPGLFMINSKPAFGSSLWRKWLVDGKAKR